MRKVLSCSKFYIIGILTLLIVSGIGCSSSTESPVLETDNDPANYYKIDVKTSFEDKFSATGIKNGHIAYMRLKGAKWCVDEETGEDYSFWIKDVRSVQGKDSTTIRFDLELRTPSFLTSGDLIEARKGYVVTYPNNPNWEKEGKADAALVAHTVKSVIENNAKYTKASGALISVLIENKSISDIVNFLTDTFWDDAKKQRSQLEGAMIGVITYTEMRNMIKVNLEK